MARTLSTHRIGEPSPAARDARYGHFKLYQPSPRLNDVPPPLPERDATKSSPSTSGIAHWRSQALRRRAPSSAASTSTNISQRSQPEFDSYK
jgi:hypothetical protein